METMSVGAPIDSRIEIAGLTPSQLARELTRRIEVLEDRQTDNRYSMDYCSAAEFGEGKRDQPVRDRYRWVGCFPVTGGNEGHYLHVVLIYQTDEKGNYLPANLYRELLTIKVFGGWDAAAELAGIIGRWLDA